MKYTLTDKEFGDLHNGLASIQNAAAVLDKVINAELMSSLEAAVVQLRRGLEGVRNQEAAFYDQRNAMFDEVSREFSFKNSVWSIFEVEDMSENHGLGDVVNTLEYRSHWGPSAVSVPVQGNTWIDLWRAADQAIVDSGDQHHVFIETLEVDPLNPTVVTLHTGS